jgi:hypothetical protein
MAIQAPVEEDSIGVFTFAETFHLKLFQHLLKAFKNEN